MNRAEARKEACFHAALALQGLMDNGWPSTNTTDEDYTEADALRVGEEMAAIVGRLFDRSR